jgi:hypothetical protein
MKFFYPKVAFIFLLIFSSSVYAQENCVSIEQTSEILLNLNLGMTVEEVNQRFSSFKIKIKNNNDYRFFQNYVDRKPPQNLSGVRALYLRFFEKKLYQIEIFYEENKYPAEIKSFTEVISNQLSLPVSNWKFANRQGVLNCGETSLTADYQLNPRIELTNETIRKQIAELNKKSK